MQTHGGEELPLTQGQGQWPREATPRQRSEAMAESARLRQGRSGEEELPHIRGQGQRPGGATPDLR